MVDDLGYSDIGAYNSTSFYETPNIDQLAASGTLFTNGYAANPVCSPSRLALLAGSHPTRYAATDWFHVRGWPHRVERYRPASTNEYLPHDVDTLPEVLKRNGYNTAFLGKWHLGEPQEYWPEHHGFDVNIGGHEMGQPAGGYFSPYENPRLGDGEDGEYLTRRLTDEAIQLVDDYADDDKPFLIYLSYYTVHTPLEAPLETVLKYKDKHKTLDPDLPEFADELQVWPTSEPRRVRIRQSHPTYAAMVEHLDANVGRLLEKLRSRGLNKNTVVVFTSDNGGLSTAEGSPTSNLPLRGGKGWLYEGGIRVPYIVRVPGGATNGAKVDVPVNGIDLLPTLLDLAGVELRVTQPLDGISLVDILEGSDGSQLSDRAHFWHYPHYSNQGGMPGSAVRVGDWKLIESLEDGSIQMYDLHNDIGETTDVSADEPEIAQRLRGLLHSWYQETDSRFLEPVVDGAATDVPFRPKPVPRAFEE